MKKNSAVREWADATSFFRCVAASLDSDGCFLEPFYDPDSFYGRVTPCWGFLFVVKNALWN